MNGWAAFPLVLGAVCLTAGGELERMVVQPAPVVAPPREIPAGETIAWKTPPSALELPSPSFALSFSSLLAQAQEKTPEKTPKLTSKPDKCKLRQSRSRACRRRG